MGAVRDSSVGLGKLFSDFVVTFAATHPFWGGTITLTAKKGDNGSSNGGSDGGSISVVSGSMIQAPTGTWGEWTLDVADRTLALSWNQPRWGSEILSLAAAEFDVASGAKEEKREEGGEAARGAKGGSGEGEKGKEAAAAVAEKPRVRPSRSRQCK